MHTVFGKSTDIIETYYVIHAYDDVLVCNWLNINYFYFIYLSLQQNLGLFTKQKNVDIIMRQAESGLFMPQQNIGLVMPSAETWSI
jgi:hypothetical protein